ncbi:hypothetical protein P175DRAFT_0502944 [Aspergillus ochraceoroseus IBT 24754]|uniref:DUF8035 domain-containing protein n=3 Tax=Aspergillus subgen. Nidulantes TaxID=2720870 RepID=A0A0F8USD4_9EURO|nr:uncharacterized protein P175DRAFT_0502944 [Aspergillus ochraceoroseus IBT 24754]KKK13746.1 hypothetical protein ARAM_001670 [Aspergillus rambellii]KKK16766.1 hypothetical protein AOCH_001772 [Aspergillus ochraceoroseus]PTU19406.1 hypothetical protein P175DRAFT_0502944 [Aspergillus ochraceoroseus IBT 24754]
MSSRFSDFRRSTGVVDADSEYYSRENRGRHRTRGGRVVEEDRWSSRLQETDRYGPPARRPSRHYEDAHLLSGSLVHYERRHAESPPPRPRLLRRQSSLDTFDRIPSRKIDEYYQGYLPRAAPSPPPQRRGPSRRSLDVDEYEEIRVADPDVYSDEEFHRFRERDRFTDRRRRSDSRFRERVVGEVNIGKPYPRKGKTRMPRKLVHTRAIREFGYPFEEEGDLVIIQLALSKEQIDAVIERSREIKRASESVSRQRARSPVRATSRLRRVDRVAMETLSPRTSETLIIEPSPSRHRSPSRRHYDYIEKTTKRSVSRTRSTSVHGLRARRCSSPVRMLIHNREDRIEEPRTSSSQLAIVVRPRETDHDLGEYVTERPGGREVIRDTKIIGDGEEEEILEVKKERKGPTPRLLRAMLATMT